MSSYWKLSKADIRSVHLSESDEEEVAPSKAVKRAQPKMSGRNSEGGESAASLGGLADGRAHSGKLSDTSLSTERHIMKEQLQHVKAALNALETVSSPGPAAAGPSNTATATPTQPSTSAAKLTSESGAVEELIRRIEGMFGEMSSRLTRVDARTADNERTLRELQHISAGAINETARLVDMMGSTAGRSTSPIPLRSGNPLATPSSAGARLQRHALGAGDFTGGATASIQVASAIHQHASQIHKLIAGLDFLEQHIIRQDQTIEGIQKQVLAVSALQSGLHAPNELALRLHDVSELVNKLRSHLYKLDKKSSANESGLQALTVKVSQLTERVESLETGQTGDAIRNPLFSESPGASEGYVRASEFEALKAQVALLMSRQQGSQQQGVSAPLSASGALNAAAALAETDEQLEALRAQQAAAAETISKLNSELGSVKRQLAAVVDMVGDAQHLSSQVSMSRSLSIGGGASAAAGPPGDEGTAKLIQALQATLDDMSTRMAAAEAAAAAAAGADAVVNLEKDMAALSARIAANAAAIAMASSMNGPAGGSAERSATGELAAESALSELRASVEELQAAAAARAAAEAERTAALAAEVSALRRELEATRKGSEEGLGSLVVSSMVARATTGAMLQATSEAVQVLLDGAASRRELADVQATVEQVANDVLALRGEAAELQASQLNAKGALETVGAQVVELGGKLEEEVSRHMSDELQLRKEVKACQDLMLEVRSVAESELEALRCEFKAALEESVSSTGTIKQAVAKLILDVERMQTVLSESSARLGELATQVQLAGVASVVEEMQNVQRDTLAELNTLKDALERDYINHEKLGAIFAAREDMRAALSKLEHVFTSGHLSKQASKEVSRQLEAVEDTLVRAGLPTSPRVSAQLEDLEAKISELQAQLSSLQTEQAQCSRTAAAAAAAVQSIKTEAPASPRSSTKRAVIVDALQPAPSESSAVQQGAVADVEALAAGAAPRLSASMSTRRSRSIHVPGSLEDRVRVMEQQIRDLRDFAADTEGDLPVVKASVADLQLMVFELRSAAAATSTSMSGAQGDISNTAAALSNAQGSSQAESADISAGGTSGEGAGSHQYPGFISGDNEAAGTSEPSAQDADADEHEAVAAAAAAAGAAAAAAAGPSAIAVVTPADSALSPGTVLEVHADEEALHELHQLVDATAAALQEQMSALALRVDALAASMEQQQQQAVHSQVQTHQEAAQGASNVEVQQQQQQVALTAADVATKQDLAGLTSSLQVVAGKVLQLEGALNSIAGSLSSLQASAVTRRSAPETAAASTDVAGLSEPGHAEEHAQAAAASSSEPPAAAASSQVAPFSSSEPAAVAAAAASTQVALLSRLVDVVSGTSSRLRGQYADEPEAEGALQAVDSRLSAVQAALGSGSQGWDMSSQEGQAAFADAMVTVLEQVAALRTIGSQTHPALQQMVLTHDSQLQALEARVQSALSSAATTAALEAVSAAEELRSRLGRLEAGYKKLSEGQTALNRAVEVFTAGALEDKAAAAGAHHASGDGSSATGEDVSNTNGVAGQAALRAVAAKVAQLEELLTQLSPKVPVGEDLHRTPSEFDAAAASRATQQAMDSAALIAVEGKLAEYGKVLQAMRSRILALQEYVDSTQGMVKELHTVHGSVLMRLHNLESSSSSSGSGTPAGGPEVLQAVQADLQALEAKFAAFQLNSNELSSALAGLHRVSDRLAELDARDGEMASKLAAIGQTMPVIAGQLKGLERKLHAKLDACCSQLESLGATLAEVARMEKPDSRNPFAGLGGAGNNPTIRLLESKVELLRTALSNVAKALAADFRATVKEGSEIQ